MTTLFDYLPSQNAWKVRVLLAHLGMPYRTEYVPIFTGAGRAPGLPRRSARPAPSRRSAWTTDGRWRNPTRSSPTSPPARPTCPTSRTPAPKIVQWLCFEADYVQSSIATLRHWTMTGKARPPPRRRSWTPSATPPAKVLGVLDRVLGGGGFLTEAGYTIADIAVFAYVHRAEEAALNLAPYPGAARLVRPRAAPSRAFAGEVFPYAIDPDSGRRTALRR